MFEPDLPELTLSNAQQEMDAARLLFAHTVDQYERLSQMRDDVQAFEGPIEALDGHRQLMGKLLGTEVASWDNKTNAVGDIVANIGKVLKVMAAALKRIVQAGVDAIRHFFSMNTIYRRNLKVLAKIAAKLDGEVGVDKVHGIPFNIFTDGIIDVQTLSDYMVKLAKGLPYMQDHIREILDAVKLLRGLKPEDQVPEIQGMLANSQASLEQIFALEPASPDVERQIKTNAKIANGRLKLLDSPKYEVSPLLPGNEMFTLAVGAAQGSYRPVVFTHIEFPSKNKPGIINTLTLNEINNFIEQTLKLIDRLEAYQDEAAKNVGGYQQIAQAYMDLLNTGNELVSSSAHSDDLRQVNQVINQMMNEVEYVNFLNRAFINGMIICLTANLKTYQKKD